MVLYAIYNYLLKAEHDVERYLLDDNKIDFVASLPWVLCSAIIWYVLMKTLPKDASTIHAVIVSLVSIGNLLLGHNEYEFIGFYIMTGYFFTDFFVNCLKPECLIYGFHHIITVLASYRMINQRNWNETLFASSCWLVELSTPFLNHFQAHGNILSGTLFFISFFLFRVVWLGWLSITGWAVAINRLEFAIIVGFTALNYWWFIDITRTAIRTLQEMKSMQK